MVVAKLHEEDGIGESADYLVLVGDHTRICELKQEYGTDLDWVIPFIGDWHFLSNYQLVLMKVYYDAGLKDLAESSGSYMSTHQFLLQAWETLYRQMFRAFKCAMDSDSEDSCFRPHSCCKCQHA